MLKRIKEFFLFSTLWAQLVNTILMFVVVIDINLICWLAYSLVITAGMFIIFLITDLMIKIRKFYRIGHPKQK